MKLFTGWVMSAGLVLAGTAANAQVLAPQGAGRSPYAVVSDIGGPYAAMPREAPGPGYGPMLLPPEEVYTVVRDSGFSPLGIPQRRGLVYTISVIDRGGDDGRLVIDARTGRIIRFMPAYRMGDNLNEDLTITYGPVGPDRRRRSVRSPGRGRRCCPKVASRTPAVPMPKARHPSQARRRRWRPSPHPSPRSSRQRRRRLQNRWIRRPQHPLHPQPSRPSPPPQIQLQPTQEMPKAQGLE